MLVSIVFSENHLMEYINEETGKWFISEALESPIEENILHFKVFLVPSIEGC